MPPRDAKLSAVDLRIMSGPRIVAEGAAMDGFTPNELMRRQLLVRVVCRGCPRRGHLDLYFLRDADQGEVPLRRLIPRLFCPKCGARDPKVDVVDPWRDAAEG